jgi:sugar lactone lactonase YvrE
MRADRAVARAFAAAALTVVLTGAGEAAGAAAAAPRVSGQRTTGAARPAYRFSFPEAMRFLCAFDSPRLHRCANPYAERLVPAVHELRVRAVLAGGKLSGVATVRVVVLGLSAGSPLTIGQGPGRPAVAGGAVWVPNGIDGTVSRVDASRGVASATIAALPHTPPLASDAECQSRYPAGDPSFVGCRYVDSAFAVGNDLWVGSDYGGQLVRIDTASGRVLDRIPVAPRPGGFALGGGFLWVFHTQRPTITRVDPASGSTESFTIAGALGAGICYARGSLWLLSGVSRGQLLRIDPSTHEVTARLTLAGFDRVHPFKEAWSLACDEQTIWASNPNYNALTQIDAATAAVKRVVRFGSYLATVDEPEGLDLAGNAVWVAARTAVARLDSRNGVTLGVVTFPQLTQYTNVVFGQDAAWRTDFYAGTLTRVVLTEAARLASPR